MPIRVSVIEDDEAERRFLQSLLERTPGFECVGAHGSKRQALTAITAESPNVIILDYRVPEWSDGLECLRQFRTSLPQVPVVMWTIEDNPERLFAALKAGAVGYLLKGASPGELVEGLTQAVNGGAPMSPPIARRVIDSFHHVEPDSADIDRLTNRERQIVELFAQGQTYKEVASNLQISENTVRSHLRQIYDKLHVTSKTHAVARFLKGV